MESLGERKKASHVMIGRMQLNTGEQIDKKSDKPKELNILAESLKLVKSPNLKNLLFWRQEYCLLITSKCYV